jgi:hypothetical protein
MQYMQLLLQIKMDDAEEFYNLEIEKADQDFLKNLGDKKDKNELEKRYREKLKKIHEKYTEAVTQNIFEQRKRLIKPKIKEEKVKPFKVKSQKISLSLLEELRMKSDLFFFKAKINFKNFIDQIIPYRVIILRIKARKFIRRTHSNILLAINAFFSKKKEKILSLYIKIKEKLMAVYGKLASFLVKIKNLFLSLKKIYRGPEKTEENKTGQEEKIETTE